jgi:putative transcriptional regulator
MNTKDIAAAIEADAGHKLPGLEESIQQMKTGLVGRQYSANQRFVREVRRGLKLSQANFAQVISAPIGTLRDWEQGRAEPPGPAVKLVSMIQRHPDLIDEMQQAHA